MNPALFRPSSMLRRKVCPGSLALESSLSQVEDENPYQAEGKKLHALTADPSLSRDSLEPSQLDLVLAVESAESEFISKILAL